MCGIAGTIGLKDDKPLIQMLNAQKHRGPDGRDILRRADYNFFLGHDRLAIVDVKGGMQPIPNEDKTLWVVVNGEIYNHHEIRERLRGRHTFRTKSDSEVVVHLFEEEGPDLVRDLDGMFAIALWGEGTSLFLARDPVGIKPLYYGYDAGGHFYFSSEIKALAPKVLAVTELLNGHYLVYGGHPVQYYSVPLPRPEIMYEEEAISAIDQQLHKAVQKRLMADVPLGVFLSGGLDSSLIAAITKELVRGELHSFSVGFEGSSDIENARTVAKYLGTIHHEQVLTPSGIMAALPEVIVALESFDPALVRSAIPTFFVSQLAAKHVKVALSGEGADELFAGYEYLQGYVPDWDALSQELHFITRNLHNSNLQRVDRMTMAHGLEGRVPFLDVDLIDLAFRIDPTLKWREDGKWILRKVGEKYLPKSIAWRKKEKFALGTGIGPLLEKYAADHVSDNFSNSMKGSKNSVSKKEEYLYWMYFKDRYGREDIVQAMGRSRSL
jgi:asparagine synthase (glutamine-hydrolysing)